MKITVIGTGYVGLVTGVTLSSIGHEVICVDVDQAKIDMLKKGISPIYEPGIEDLIEKNLMEEKLDFTTDVNLSIENSDIIFIAVATPPKKDGSADLTYIEKVSLTIAKSIKKNTIVVTKSTVPIGTNRNIESLINKNSDYQVSIVSNPEFLREGSALKDVFDGDRIVIGSDHKESLEVIKKINSGFNIPILETELESAEMIKYSSNAFLATKISFINEIANLCEASGASISEVSKGMGMDHRIGESFLQAGIGYGGSCFPKDTLALTQIAEYYSHEFNLLKSVVNINQKQQLKLVNKLNTIYPSLKNKKIAILGVAFKPNTDDIREAASTKIMNALLEQEANVYAYDPIAWENSKKIFGDTVNYCETIEELLDEADAALVVTEWEIIKKIDLRKFKQYMKNPVVLDGRSVFSMKEMKKQTINYYSVGEGNRND